MPFMNPSLRGHLVPEKGTTSQAHQSAMPFMNLFFPNPSVNAQIHRSAQPQIQADGEAECCAWPDKNATRVTPTFSSIRGNSSLLS